jgi:hypothetical protein
MLNSQQLFFSHHETYYFHSVLRMQVTRRRVLDARLPMEHLVFV